MINIYYSQYYFWINYPLYFFKLFNNIHASNIMLISCFNSVYLNKKIIQNKKIIYYSGERFLSEKNSDIIISFIPDSIDIYNIIKYNSYKKNLEIIEIDLINSTYNNNNNLTKTNTKLKNLNTNKIYIQLRDHERFQCELFLKNNNLLSINKINIYSKLDIIWNNIYNKYMYNTSKIVKDKPNFACFIVSNSMCWQRNKMFEILKLICNKKVDSLGKFKKNVDFIIPDRETQQDEYLKLINKYRYIISFENTSLAWYQTEKIYNAFMSGTIPIYWGDPLITETYNPECFIHVPAYTNKNKQIHEIIKTCEYIKSIENDLENKYILFFKNKLMMNPEKEDTRIRNNIKKIYYAFNNKYNIFK